MGPGGSKKKGEDSYILIKMTKIYFYQKNYSLFFPIVPLGHPLLSTL